MLLPAYLLDPPKMKHLWFVSLGLFGSSGENTLPSPCGVGGGVQI